ncbi:MAG: chemotaxis protein CheA, partial [Thermodesulfobacteriota bacterium]
MDDAEIQKQLLAAFQAESRERIEALYTGLATLEKDAGEASAQTAVETVFREAHSLKGAARSVNLAAIESLCQELESIFAALKDEALPLTPELTDRLYAAVGLIEQATAPEASPDEVSDELKKMGGALSELKTAGPAPQLSDPDTEQPDETEGGDAETGGAEPAAAEPKEPAAETPAAKATERTSSEAAAVSGHQPAASLSLQSVRVPAAKLDSLLLKAEELITVKQSSAQHLNQLNSLQDLLGQWQKQWERFQADSPRAGNHQKDLPDNEAAHTRTHRFLEETREVIRKLEQHLKQASAAFDVKRRHFDNLVDDLLNATKKTSLMPFSTLFSVFPRMVRDIARDSGKSVDLSLSGETVEVDKRILEGLKDPLMHLLRNAVDHGIEAPVRRTERGKPETGSIRITAFQPESSHVSLSIADDGAGIDTAAVIADALDKGLITAEAADTMEAPEALDLIFRSGISSSPRVSEISGRGLGMPIVREGIEKMGGSIHLESEPGVGSTFHIRLPVTLATFRGILIEADAQLFIVPNAHVRNSLQIRREAIQTVEGQPAVFFQDRPLALVSLSELLGLPPAKNKNGNQNNRKGHAHVPALILGHGGEALAVRVDRILSEQEI